MTTNRKYTKHAAAVVELEVLSSFLTFCCTDRLAKTVDDINEQLDELKYEAEDVLCSSFSTS